MRTVLYLTGLDNSPVLPGTIDVSRRLAHWKRAQAQDNLAHCLFLNKFQVNTDQFYSTSMSSVLKYDKGHRLKDYAAFNRYPREQYTPTVYTVYRSQFCAPCEISFKGIQISIRPSRCLSLSKLFIPPICNYGRPGCCDLSGARIGKYDNTIDIGTRRQRCFSSSLGMKSWSIGVTVRAMVILGHDQRS